MGIELNFKSTTHEYNLYRGEIDGETVLLCRQIDDFAIASASRETSENLTAAIIARVTTGSQGLGTRYNIIDLLQTRDYVKVLFSTGPAPPGWVSPPFSDSFGSSAC
jgi:hypothetical protein